MYLFCRHLIIDGRDSFFGLLDNPNNRFEGKHPFDGLKCSSFTRNVLAVTCNSR
jgi:hypothetical protein